MFITLNTQKHQHILAVNQYQMRQEFCMDGEREYQSMFYFGIDHPLHALQDIEYLKLYSSRYGRDEGLALLEKTGVYLGPERYTLEHMAIDVMRGEIFNACRS